MNVLIECSGFHTKDFFIPPFTIRKGTVTVLFLHNDAHYYPLKNQLTQIFTGASKQEGVIIHEPFRFVRSFTQNAISEKLFPATINSYLKKHSNKNNKITAELYKLQDMYPQRNIYSMEATDRKLMDIFIALSHSGNIIFDLAGQSPSGIEETIHLVHQKIKDNGAAIILDNWPDLQHQCDQYIPIVPLSEK